MIRVRVPSRLAGRSQARAMLDSVPIDLRDTEVLVDCSKLEASTPSSVDELVKVLVLGRGARLIRFQSSPERMASYARRSSAARSIESRVVIDTGHTASLVLDSN